MQSSPYLKRGWRSKPTVTNEDTRGVKPWAWKVFDQIGDVGGSISPSDYESFTFNSNAAMRPHIKSLEDAQLVDSAIDETDNRRRTIGISARGWIVRYKRSGYIRQKPKLKRRHNDFQLRRSYVPEHTATTTHLSK